MSVTMKNLFYILLFNRLLNTNESSEEVKIVNPCNKQVLESLNLDGFSKSDALNELSICKNVSEQNNCCNPIDEIKALKTWTNFSKPKIDYFLNEITSLYKKILDLHPYIEKLDDQFIRFHGPKLVQVNIKEQKYFQGNNYLSEENLQELIYETQSVSEWYLDYSKKIISAIVDYITKYPDPWYIPNETVFTSLVINPLYDNTKLKELIVNTVNDFILDNNTKLIVDEVIAAFQFAPRKAYKLTGDGLRMKIQDIFNKKINLASFVKNVLLKEIPRKELKDIHEATYMIHFMNFKNYMIDNNYLLFDPPMVQSSDLVGLYKDIFKSISINTDLKLLLSYMITPENILNPDPALLRSYIENHLLKAINDNILESKSVAKQYRLRIFNYLQLTFKQYFNIKKYLFTSLYQSSGRFLALQMLSKIFENLSKSYPNKLSSLIYAYNRYVADKNLIVDPLITDKSYNEVVLEDYKNILAAKVKSVFSNVVKEVDIANTELSNSQITEAFNHAKNSYIAILKDNIYKSINDDKKVLATVTRHTLIEKQVFNNNKFNHCKKALETFLRIDVNAIKNDIEKMKKKLEDLLNIKKSLYCFACDKTKTKFIDVMKNTITFSKQFCFDLLTQYDDYLKWKNDKMVQYFYDVFQYLKCYDTDGSIENYPYEFFNQSHLEIQTKIKKCAGIKDLDQVNDCKDMCIQFSLTSYSNIFDGDKKFIEQVYAYFLNVLRIYGFMYKKKQVKNLTSNARLLEESNLNDNLSVNTNKSSIFSDNDIISQPKYSKRKLKGQVLSQDKVNNHSDNILNNQEKTNDESLTYSEITKKEDFKEFIGNKQTRLLEDQPSKPLIPASPITNSDQEEIKRQKLLRRLNFKGRSSKWYTKLVKDIYNKNAILDAPTRKDYEMSNELTKSHINYDVMEPKIEFDSFNIIIEDDGLNPLAVAKNFNFEFSSISKPFVIDKNDWVEDFNVTAVRVCVTITTEEIEMFNKDILSLDINEEIPQKKAKPVNRTTDPNNALPSENNQNAASNSETKAQKKRKLNTHKKFKNHKHATNTKKSENTSFMFRLISRFIDP